MKDNTSIVVLAAVAIGIPLLISMALFSGNEGIKDGMGTTLSLFFVLGTFIAGMVFEIKRIADLPVAEDVQD